MLFSCGNKSQKEETNAIKSKPLLSVVKEHQKIKDVSIIYKKEVKDWKELNSLNSFITKFHRTSPNEALSNAIELQELTKNLKDSIKPKLFEIPSFKARINILNNETLRLVDLTFIPAITAEEVNLQVEKILTSLSTVNAKINTILSQKRFEDDIDIDVDVSFIGIDTTKIDSASLNTIKNFDKKKPKTPFKENKKDY